MKLKSINLVALLLLTSISMLSPSHAAQKTDKHLQEAINSCAKLVNDSKESIYATRFVSSYGDAYQPATKKDYQGLIANVCAEGIAAAQKYNNINDLDLFLFSMRRHWVDILGTPVEDVEAISRNYFKSIH